MKKLLSKGLKHWIAVLAGINAGITHYLGSIGPTDQDAPRGRYWKPENDQEGSVAGYFIHESPLKILRIHNTLERREAYRRAIETWVWHIPTSGRQPVPSTALSGPGYLEYGDTKPEGVPFPVEKRASKHRRRSRQSTIQ